MVHLRERRSIVDVMEQKSEALTDLAETLAQRRLQQAEVMAQQRRLLALIAGTAELETLLSQLNDLASKHQVLISSTVPSKVMRAQCLWPRMRLVLLVIPGWWNPLLMQGLESALLDSGEWAVYSGAGVFKVIGKIGGFRRYRRHVGGCNAFFVRR